MQGILNKINGINFFVGFMVWLWCWLLERQLPLKILIHFMVYIFGTDFSAECLKFILKGDSILLNLLILFIPSKWRNTFMSCSGGQIPRFSDIPPSLHKWLCKDIHHFFLLFFFLLSFLQRGKFRDCLHYMDQFFARWLHCRDGGGSKKLKVLVLMQVA